MRGRPVIQWIVFAAAWLLLLGPLVRVTFRSSPAVAEPATVEEVIPTWVHLTFSSAPERVELYQGPDLLWSADRPSGFTFEESVPLVFDAFGTDIRLTARFAEQVRTAVEVTLAPDGRSERSSTVWSEGDIDRRLEFSWGDGHD